MFTDMVNVTDEALVMPVVRNYFPRCDKVEEIGAEDKREQSSEIGSMISRDKEQ